MRSSTLSDVIVEPWTIRRVLAWTRTDLAGRGIESARLDAELLVSTALGVDRVRLYMDLDRPLVENERARIRELVKRRRAREPVAYILGRREFWGRCFEVDPAVLIPRPDTETLVERALEVVPLGRAERVLDLCTGSGAIGLTVAAERPEVTVDLTDLSVEALNVARRNANNVGVADRVRTLQGDLFEPLDRSDHDTRYGLIVCNPPYVSEAEVESLSPEVRDYEPRAALVSGPTGFEFHARLLEGASRFLSPGGTLLIEVGAGQAQDVVAAFEAAPWTEVARWIDDLCGVARVVEVRAARTE